MALRITTLVGVLALLLAAPAAIWAQETETTADQQEAIAEAKTAAKAWLALLDAQDYTATWEQAGELLKGAVELRRWQRTMSVTLGPLGQVASRAVRTSKYSTTLPHAPDGEYVVIEYDTSFESQQTALEEVILKNETDGMWRVSGYRIK
jgi:hypothetical protein